MNNYTFTFGGEITVKAETEEVARELVDELVAPSSYAYDNCEDISVYELELIEAEESEETRCFIFYSNYNIVSANVNSTGCNIYKILV